MTPDKPGWWFGALIKILMYMENVCINDVYEKSERYGGIAEDSGIVNIYYHIGNVYLDGELDRVLRRYGTKWNDQNPRPRGILWNPNDLNVASIWDSEMGLP